MYRKTLIIFFLFLLIPSLVLASSNFDRSYTNDDAIFSPTAYQWLNVNLALPSFKVNSFTIWYKGSADAWCTDNNFKASIYDGVDTVDADNQLAWVADWTEGTFTFTTNLLASDLEKLNFADSIGDGNCWSVKTSSDYYTPYDSLSSDNDEMLSYILNYGASDYTISDPLDNSFIPVGEYVFSGDCPTDGTDVLFLSRYYTGFYDDWFDIDCIDNQWTATTTIELNKQNIFLSLKGDSDNSEQQVVTVYGQDTSALNNYFLNITYPTDDNEHYFVRQPSDDAEFTFTYQLPYYDLATSTTFEVLEYEGLDWSGDYTKIFSNSLEFYDAELVGSFTLDSFIASSTKVMYYEANLLDSNDDLQYSLKFRVSGTGDSTTPSPTAPAIKDYGFLGNLLRSLFVPDRRFMIDYVEVIPDELAKVVPFCYYYQVKGEIENLSVTASSTTEISLTVPFEGQNLNLPLLDTTIEGVNEFSNGIRPFFEVAIWVALLFYIIHRVFDFEI